MNLYFMIAIQLLNVMIVCPVDYCLLPCDNLINTACEQCGISRRCHGPYYHEYLPNYEDRMEILTAHNTIRENVASGKSKHSILRNMTASNMNAISYDTSLEHVAMCWVRRCNVSRDKCRRTERFRYVGQNVFFYSGGNCKDKRWYTTAIEFWYRDVQNFSTRCLLSYNGCNNILSQVLWAETRYVGCGKVRLGKEGKCWMVCNYGPAGNRQGLPIFLKGIPRTQCTDKNNTVGKKYLALCGSEDAGRIFSGATQLFETYSILSYLTLKILFL